MGEKIRDLTMNLKFTEIQAAAAEREVPSCSKSWIFSSPVSPTGRTNTEKSASNSSRPSTKWPDTNQTIFCWILIKYFFLYISFSFLFFYLFEFLAFYIGTQYAFTAKE